MIFYLWLLLGSFAYAGDCPSNYTAITSREAYQKTLLRDLQREAARNEHTVELRGNRVYVTIATLYREQQSFLKLLLLAAKEGLVSEIDAGLVVGPKALILLNRLRTFAAGGGQKIVVKGTIGPANVNELMLLQSETKSTSLSEATSRWSQGEIDDYKRALDELGIHQACQDFYRRSIESCGYLDFEFQSGDDYVSWQK